MAKMKEEFMKVNEAFQNVEINPYFNIVNEVVDWNKKRNLHTQGFNREREAGFIYEELLELFGLNQSFKSKHDFRLHVKDEIEFLNVKSQKENPLTVQDQADALGDIIIFAIGGLLKICNDNPELGYPNKILETIALANREKGLKLDADGKVIKNNNFKEPEL